MFGGDGAGLVAPRNDSWIFNENTHTWAQVTSTNPGGRGNFMMAPVAGNKVVIQGGDLNGNGIVTFDSWVFDGNVNTWAPVTGPVPPAARGLSIATLSNGRAIMLGSPTVRASLPVNDLWIFDPATSAWLQLKGVIGSAATNARLTTLSNGKTVMFGSDTWVVDPKGGATTALGSVSLASLGITPATVTRLSARANVGADGFDATDANPLNGGNLQLYRMSDQGDVFQTCASTTALASATSPENISCNTVPFAGSSTVALRLAPRGFSNTHSVPMTVNAAELDVTYRLP